MVEFMQQYGTEAKAYRALYRARWPHGLRCPACDDRRRSRFRRGRQVYYPCRACRHQTPLLSGTIFEATQLPLRTGMLAIHLLTATKTTMAAPLFGMPTSAGSATAASRGAARRTSRPS